MKRKRFSSPDNGTRKVACTVSAAALMLGVSQAATVGFNFQANYCASPSYSGAIVTAQAFGIAPSGWENLTPMITGYTCGNGNCAFSSLSQVIDTTTSSGGLNPLPNGSLTVNWGGYNANVSGFGGYSRPGPHYTFGGNSYNPGNEQVYWGFIRDGVNFGPAPGTCGPSGGDNNQPGYNIDITGLKTLFTNTPFAVQLIASTDSMEYLTNAFIIDATANTTQSVVYPSTPPVGNVGDTAWVRGIGGGLSTASGSVDTDHLKIIGNRAAHSAGPPSYNFASTICGFIITDKPVISMSPTPVLVCGGDTVTWSGYAVGVPPLSYQWRKNGTPIPGATGSALTIANVSLNDIATYDLRVTNLYGTAISSPVTVDEIQTAKINNLVLDSKPQGPEQDGLNNGATWLATSTDSANVTRSGVMSFVTNVPTQVVVPTDANFNSSTGTISFWMRSSGLANPSGNPATLFDRLTGNGCVIVQQADGTILFQAGPNNNPAGAVTTTNALSDNKWHHVAVTYEQSTASVDGGVMSIYVDGQFDSSSALFLDWSWPAAQEIELGLSHDTSSWQAYQGLLDDVRVYNRILSDAEIASLHNDAIVDANALVMRLNFTAAPGQGVTLRWGCGDAVLQSADSVNGPYTDVAGASSPYNVSVLKSAKFYRYHGHSAVTIVANPYLM